MEGAGIALSDLILRAQKVLIDGADGLHRDHLKVIIGPKRLLPGLYFSSPEKQQQLSEVWSDVLSFGIQILIEQVAVKALFKLSKNPIEIIDSSVLVLAVRQFPGEKRCSGLAFFRFSDIDNLPIQEIAEKQNPPHKGMDLLNSQSLYTGFLIILRQLVAKSAEILEKILIHCLFGIEMPSVRLVKPARRQPPEQGIQVFGVLCYFQDFDRRGFDLFPFLYRFHQARIERNGNGLDQNQHIRHALVPEKLTQVNAFRGRTRRIVFLAIQNGTALQTQNAIQSHFMPSPFQNGPIPENSGVLLESFWRIIEFHPGRNRFRRNRNHRCMPGFFRDIHRVVFSLRVVFRSPAGRYFIHFPLIFANDSSFRNLHITMQ
uniref:Uncharacterized protein n=1 Tax=Candidatus Kentrum sp. MB TaxID=2138164 RepID=A0A451BGK0_9GAMM|nr:MAG: hypothetical protein BECKMB1821G_GA0114241_11291 [Candidatus Kentron sp. MB]VFK35619.1 MAG: hypothetical protein BECKMB1821I_GA0114274_11321 [Candidatus Kentron sp. MB]VFK77419.1 MAG: hypothetical protein BECKMB1821H_GA0114242_11361 [Candidatus Kentron sp. MB]